MDYPITELAGKTLGIIGYGTIGQRVAQIATALGMNVIISNRPGSNHTMTERHTLSETLELSDILSLHCPLTNNNQHLINAHTLAQMKPTAWLINTARGGLIDEHALAHALRNKQLGAAALDCLSIEPPPADHPLLAPDIPNLLITPHCAWASQPARQMLVNEIGENIRAFKRGEIRNPV